MDNLLLEWLLEKDEQNPSVRYFALRDLVGLDESEPELKQAAAEIMQTGPVPAILERQAEGGYWFKPGVGYSPKYQATTWTVFVLAELGASPQDARVRKGCEYVLNHSLSKTAGFSCVANAADRGSVICRNGNLLHSLNRLGYGQDKRVIQAQSWMSSAVAGAAGFDYKKTYTSAPGYVCSVNAGQPCGWGAVKVMNALLDIPENQQTEMDKQAIQAGADLLLSVDVTSAAYPYTGNVSSTWFRLGFPLSYWSDVLEVATVLARLRYANHPRMAGVVDWLESKKGKDGRWRLENSLNGKMWADIEENKKTSKWITLRVLQFLKSFEGKNQ